MNKRDITKKVARFAVTNSVAYSITSTILNNTTTNGKPLQTAEAYVGAYAVGMMVSDYSAEFTDRKVDDLFDWFDSFR